MRFPFNFFTRESFSKRMKQCLGLGIRGNSLVTSEKDKIASRTAGWTSF